MTIDSEVKSILHQHLLYVKSNRPYFYHLGNLELLKTVVKIKTNEDILTNLNHGKGAIESFPQLPKRNYLVACTGLIDPSVFAIYTFEHIKRIQAMSSAGQIHNLNWIIIEIPEEIENCLSQEIKLKNEQTKFVAGKSKSEATVIIHPTVKIALQKHLRNVRKGSNSFQSLGRLELLKTAVKIKTHDEILKCFDKEGKLQSYPKLPEKNYLVACIGTENVKVFAIYSFTQMIIMQNMALKKQIAPLKWCVLEIPQELEKTLTESKL